VSDAYALTEGVLSRFGLDVKSSSPAWDQWEDVIEEGLKLVGEDQVRTAFRHLEEQEQKQTPAKLGQKIKALIPSDERNERVKNECGTCDGTWWVSGGEVVGASGNRVSVVERCPDCHGAGRAAPVHKVRAARMPEHLRVMFSSEPAPERQIIPEPF